MGIEQMYLKNTLREKLKIRANKKILDLNEALYAANNKILRNIIKMRGRSHVVESTMYSFVYRLSQPDIENLKQTAFRYDANGQKLTFNTNSNIYLFISHAPNTEPAETMSMNITWIKDNDEHVTIAEESMTRHDCIKSNYKSYILVDKLWIIAEHIVGQ